MSADFYDLLGIPEDASQDEIRDAYRSKVRTYHPDHNDDPRANAQFTALKKAYDTLGDPVERNAYDRMGHLDYVGKRLDGLPDPDTWAPTDAGDDGGSATASGVGGTATGSSGGSTGAGTSRSRTGGSSSRSGRSGSRTGRSSRSSGTSSRSTGGSGRSSRSAGSSGAGTGGASARRTASDGAGAATRSHVAYEIDPVVEWIAEHRRIRRLVGWELIWIVLGVYAASMAAFAVSNASAVADLLGRLVDAGADPGALWAALERGSMPVVADAVVWPLVGSGGGAAAIASGVLLLVAALLLPSAVGLLVYVTRTSPGWKPTFGYVAATLGPLVGIVVGLPATPPLWLELVLFVGLPLGAVFVMLLSAFVRPRVLIFLHNVRN